MNDNKELLEEIKHYIERANNLVQNILYDLRSNQEIGEFLNLIEGVSYCIEGLYNLSKIGLENITELTLKQYRDNFKKNIDEIIEALGNKDINLLVDILEYEVVELISDLNNEIKNINLI